MPFWVVSEALADARQPFDVVFFPDGRNRADSLTLEEVARYRTLVLPECRHLTERQAEVLRAYLARGGRLVVLGGVGDNLPEDVRAALTGHENTVSAGRTPRSTRRC